MAFWAAIDQDLTLEFMGDIFLQAGIGMFFEGQKQVDVLGLDDLVSMEQMHFRLRTTILAPAGSRRQALTKAAIRQLASGISPGSSRQRFALRPHYKSPRVQHHTDASAQTEHSDMCWTTQVPESAERTGFACKGIFCIVAYSPNFQAMPPSIPSTSRASILHTFRWHPLFPCA
jgi:hypothetical protein